ncbi:hypothetical protein Y032_0029g1857 [Ancylostoma ceylanicum]|nr:hypothetical protein Y032_0029g1857 [Ancylostoma ceylanicum]
MASEMKTGAKILATAAAGTANSGGSTARAAEKTGGTAVEERVTSAPPTKKPEVATSNSAQQQTMLAATTEQNGSEKSPSPTTENERDAYVVESQKYQTGQRYAFEADRTSIIPNVSNSVLYILLFVGISLIIVLLVVIYLGIRSEGRKTQRKRKKQRTPYAKEEARDRDEDDARAITPDVVQEVSHPPEVIRVYPEPTVPQWHGNPPVAEQAKQNISIGSSENPLPPQSNRYDKAQSDTRRNEDETEFEEFGPCDTTRTPSRKEQKIIDSFPCILREACYDNLAIECEEDACVEEDDTDPMWTGEDEESHETQRLKYSMMVMSILSIIPIDEMMVLRATSGLGNYLLQRFNYFHIKICSTKV